MLEWRQVTVILFFFAVCSGIILYSSKVSIDDDFNQSKRDLKNKTPEQESYFKIASLYLFKNDQDQLYLASDELMIDNISKRSSFVKPKGFFYTKDRDQVFYESLRGLYRPDDSAVVFQEEVDIKAGASFLKSQLATYLLNKDFFVSEGNVQTETKDLKTGDKILINAPLVHAWPKSKRSDYEGGVKGQIRRKRPYEPDVYFASNSIYLDMNLNQIRLEGDVDIKRQDVVATSRRGEIYLDNQSKRLKYYTLFDDVKVIEKLKINENQLIERKAFGEKLEGIISEDKLILTGSPKVLQEDDVVKGNKITLRENNEVIEVEDASSNFTVKKKGP